MCSTWPILRGVLLTLTLTALARRSSPQTRLSLLSLISSTSVFSATSDRRELPLSQPPATYWREENTLSLWNPINASLILILCSSQKPQPLPHAPPFPSPTHLFAAQDHRFYHPSFQGSDFFPGFLPNPSVFDLSSFFLAVIIRFLVCNFRKITILASLSSCCDIFVIFVFLEQSKFLWN